MTTLIALLRAVNVGGTGKLPMTQLKAMCDSAGFASVRTYIASGNVVFDSPLSEATVKATLEQALAAYAGKRVHVLVRSASDMAEVLKANPFPDAAPSHTVAFFLDRAATPADCANVRHQQDEQLVPGRRELYVQYPGGMGKSRLVIGAADEGTARNMNTIARLVDMAHGR